MIPVGTTAAGRKKGRGTGRPPVYKEMHNGRERIVYKTDEMEPNKLYEVKIGGRGLIFMSDGVENIRVWGRNGKD